MRAEGQAGGGFGMGWEACVEPGCLGERVTSNQKCLSHADERSRNQYLASLIESEQPLLLRGVIIDQRLLEALITSGVLSGGEIKSELRLSGCELLTPFKLEDKVLGEVNLVGCPNTLESDLSRCKVRKRLHAPWVFFRSGPPVFRNCEFADTVDLSCAQSERVSIAFQECIFHKVAKFDGLSGSRSGSGDGSITFRDCHFHSDFITRWARANLILLSHSVIEGEVDIGNTISNSVRLDHTRLVAAHQVGPVSVNRSFRARHSQFGSRVRIDVRAETVDLTGTKLLAGGVLAVERAQISLDQVSTTGQFRLIGGPMTERLPEVISIVGADVGSMSYAHVDMSRCVFHNALGLAGVGLEPTVRLERSPRFFARRRCVADEFAWRRRRGGLFSGKWILPGTRLSEEEREDEDVRILLPEVSTSQVASVYAELRRSFEMRSNEPGASDFYYGEMEMRRQNPNGAISERTIIWLYWIVSGYGLRAWRAFFWLGLLITAATIALAKYGQTKVPASATSELLLSLKATFHALGQPKDLTTAGEYILLALSIMGPVLFALCVLAIRGRVKR